MRVYVPATLELLAGWLTEGVVPWTDGALVATGQDEESEYVALMSAADASILLLDGAGRRVVVVAEVAGEGGLVPMEQVVAVHADVADFEDPDDDLAWFAAQEIDQLL